MKNVQMKIIEDSFKEKLIEEEVIENLQLPKTKERKHWEDEITRQLKA